MSGKSDKPATPTRSGSARQASKKEAPTSKAASDDKKEGKSIQDTAVYGEIVQNLVGLHEFGKEQAASRHDGEEPSTGGIKEPVAADSKKKQKKEPAAPKPKPVEVNTETPPAAAKEDGAGVKRKSNGRSGKKNLTSECVAILKEWYDKHTDWPYPGQADKTAMAAKTSMPEDTVNNWFINARKRLMSSKDREKMSNPSKKARAEGGAVPAKKEAAPKVAAVKAVPVVEGDASATAIAVPPGGIQKVDA